MLTATVCSSVKTFLVGATAGLSGLSARMNEVEMLLETPYVA